MLDAREIEELVLGASLKSPRVFSRLVPRVTAAMFSERWIREAWSDMTELDAAGQGVDVPIVARRLEARLDGDFGVKLLMAVQRADGEAEFVEDHAQAVIDAHQRRRMARLGELLVKRAGSIDTNPADALREAAAIIDDITASDTAFESSLGTLLARVNATVETAMTKGEPAGIATGVYKLDDLLGRISATDFLVLGGDSGAGKALALDTPIPTPTGFRSMGQLGVGDEVFDEDGNVCRITATSPVMIGRPCYRVRFSDGSEIIADGDHRWVTSTDAERAREYRMRADVMERRRRDRPSRAEAGADWLGARNAQIAAAARAGREERPRFDAVRTTEEIRDTLKAGAGRCWNHRVRRAGSLRLPDRSLPLPPYVLGAWLGDGNNRKPVIHCGPEDAWHIARQVAAHGVSFTTELARTSVDLVLRPTMAVATGTAGRLPRLATIDALGLYGSKRIPSAYLFASEAQRAELLQGLMDTDGHASPSGSCELTLTVKELAEDAHALICSLGMVASIAESDAVLNRRVVGRRWRIHFRPNRDVFTLPRKLARTKKPTRDLHRMIVAVEPIPSVPVKCIAVDSPSHLYLAGPSMIPTHNTALATQIALHVSRVRPVLFFAQDQSPDDIGQRILARWAGVTVSDIRDAQLDYATQERIAMALDRAAEHRLHMIRRPRITIEDIRMRIRAHAREGPLGLVVIDHLKRIGCRAKVRNEFERYAEVVSELREIATEFRVPILLLAQRTRSSQREEGAPSRHDLFGGGAIDEAADIVVLVWRPASNEHWCAQQRKKAREEGESYAEREIEARRDHIQIIVDKHRAKRVPLTGWMRFDGPSLTYQEVE